MGLENTPSSERIHISFFGKRNAGKSSIVNAITGQKVSVVSETKGTTTDPVTKAMELLPAGPVLIIDTPGFDDKGTLGELRVEKAKQILEKTDIAVLVIDCTEDISDDDKKLKKLFSDRSIPFITVFNKAELLDRIPASSENEIYISAKKNINIDTLKVRISDLAAGEKKEKKLLSDIISPGDTIVLVMPVDASAPKGRIILPQQMAIREILDTNAIAISTQPQTLKKTLSSLSHKPSLVITDSQVFKTVSETVPEDIPLTSFSVLLARYKGILSHAVRALSTLDSLEDNDTILISEGCTHHRQCGDIGTVKLPALIEKYTGKKPVYRFSSGGGFPENISDIRLVIHCGACMLNDREILSRLKKADGCSVPFTNYGTAMAYMNGILKRTLKIFPDINALSD
ncbi:MAG: [FeFe] hydrogenase H-cluster maturation GTPase HydF [Ruminococcus sp.]|nr:[FeFe] hydrogenase H-cluster maturation GTPase HydF [Ruminococcus sp.]